MSISLAQPGDGRLDDVWTRLDMVSDPELDQSVAEMGFVNSVELTDGGDVRVSFRLPTFWCAPNFAFLMAYDMREAVESLDWVRRAEITLQDHCHAEDINRGVGGGLSFAETFPDQATAELDELRATFRRKAFQGRQEALLRRLLEDCMTPENICAMRIGELQRLELVDATRLLERYLEIRGEFGGPAGENDTAFTAPDGDALSSEEFSGYLQDLRRVRVNAAFNANMCRSLLQTRYGEGGE